jgi:very-short-patch-repair endonuclease
MRREPAPAELRFWHEVRDRRPNGLKFKRQVPVGPYIADFLCNEHRLIVELDGGQHADHVARDETRDAYLKSQGYTGLRFWNAEVFTNMSGVADMILLAVRENGK